ncbi:hypothetical protein KGF57_001000 [Candida theae]|uniref:Uncharacterized protein n=1 Tax=Candida theae TaxID=1198502 RepID=A0AAD5G069_9ASCO|nr:uncharacterized protein KGF57_001000 [Candida theae]KAI5964508.1 hypothetical protein KGF57_001000 [Candida theae]
MAPKARQDLVIPYVHVPAKSRKDAGNVLSQSLPMAAMFMRNKMLSWASVFLSIQSYLNEPINKPAEEDQGQQSPALRIAFAVIALITCYMDIVFPSTNPTVKRAAKIVSETATAVTTATAAAAAKA